MELVSGSVVFACQTENNVNWLFKKGNKVSTLSADNVRTWKSNHMHWLKIEDVSKHHEGEYICRFEDEHHGTFEDKGMLDIVSSKYIKNVILNDFFWFCQCYVSKY